jgi:lysophospholipase L1-like esterase
MKNLTLTFSAVAVSVVAFELILQAMVPVSGFDRFGSQRVENLEFSYDVTHNSLGYRDEEFSTRAPRGTRRVLFIGDSFIYGVGVPRAETIPSLLEDKLDSLDASKFEVLNLGLPDGNTVQYLDTARAFSDFDAEIVLLGFYVDNDVLIYGHDREYVLLWSLIKRAIATSYYYVTGKCKYEWVYNYYSDPFYQDLACQGKINHHIIKRANRNFENEQHYYDHMSELLLKSKKIIRNIKSIRKIFHDKAFYVVITPSKYQINNAYFDELRKIGFRFKNNELVNDKFQSTLKRLLERNNILYIDLLPVIKKSYAVHNRKHFHVIDDHFNAFGYEVAAAAIAEALQTHLID